VHGDWAWSFPPTGNDQETGQTERDRSGTFQCAARQLFDCRYARDGGGRSSTAAARPSTTDPAPGSHAADRVRAARAASRYFPNRFSDW